METGMWRHLGPLMNENHALLQSLTVSSQELDHLVEAARHAGALRTEGKEYVVQDGDVIHFRFHA